MASFRKRGKSWEASISKNGVRQYATFDTKAEATAWAAKTEADILTGNKSVRSDRKLSDLLKRYAKEISSTKRGGKWETTRINAFLKESLSNIRLDDLNQTHFAEWRDSRLSVVSEGTVIREMTLLNHALNVGVKEWLWLAKNPLTGVRRPAEPPPRSRLISDDEIDRLLYALGYANEPPQTITARVGAAFAFAIETALRAGEICALRWGDIETHRRFLRVTATAFGAGKTAAAKREVPLTARAIEIIEYLRYVKTDESIFSLKSAQIDALFRKAKARSLIKDLHFHDSRAEAITRLSKKLDILALARMVGHRDLRMLQVYYRETAEDMAKKL
jgi:integrase